MTRPLVRSSPVTGSAEWAAEADVAADAGVDEPVDPPLPAPVLDGDVVVAAGVPELDTVGDVAAAGAASTTTVPCMNG